MKIAVVTDDEKTISAHFGRAHYYMVVTLADDQVVSRERRAKPGHGIHSHDDHAPVALTETRQDPDQHHDHAHEPGHHHGPAADARHTSMAGIIADCQVLLAGGMGAGMRTTLQAQGIRLILTDVGTIDAALAAYVDGTLVNLADSRHCAHP